MELLRLTQDAKGTRPTHTLGYLPQPLTWNDDFSDVMEDENVQLASVKKKEKTQFFGNFRQTRFTIEKQQSPASNLLFLR